MALIPEFFLDSVVAIGSKRQNDINWLGTGFIVGRPTGKTNKKNNKEYNIFLVTNKHVIEKNKKIILRFDTLQGNNPKDYEIVLEKNGKNTWLGHPSADIAVFVINPDKLKDDSAKFSFFNLDDHSMDLASMTQNGISEGDSIFVLGFPLGIVSDHNKHVIARAGIIARIKDVLSNKSTCYLIDANIFPGNSGGPVINKPELNSVQGTKAINQASLIGIVKSYVSYKDVAISQQTGRQRVIFEENSGLALVETVDSIKYVVDLCYAQFIKK